MKVKKIFLLVMAVVLLFPGAVSCAVPVSSDVVQSGKPRDMSPCVSQTDMDTLVEGNSEFAFDLYQALADRDGNLFYSPYSISEALAMTYAGARGETEEQMEDALHFILSQERLHPAFNGLDIELDLRGESAEGKDGEGFRLNIVNAIWGQKGYHFLPGFLDVLAENYGAGLRVLDFDGEPEKSRVIINNWVGKETEGRIEDLLAEGVIDSLTRLVLTNAIYFNAAWTYPFDENVTREGVFHLLDGEDVYVSMMNQTESFRYVTGDGYEVVELPYDGNELSMVILLPEAGNFEEFQNSLSSEKVAEIMDNLSRGQVALSLPKFEFEGSFSLADTLVDMGMPAAFSAAADFSGMTGGRDLFIADVIHKAFVSVDEAGTEAAAATAVVMDLTAMPETPIEIVADRPFIFLIRDIETGAALFVGRLMNPAA
jgi:serpin B